MKRIMPIILLIAIAINFTACGGGGGGDSSFKQETEKITMCVTNATPTDIANYLTLNSGDTIVDDEPTSIIKEDNTLGISRKVCLVSGSAHIVRN
ncbi:hypothetical protein [Poseidonibacter sp.]|uniref:hypothetical protein n=1 Tax=Poseidonibacter sp. TaxID=2321188 RepID=UPI003C77FC45